MSSSDRKGATLPSRWPSTCGRTTLEQLFLSSRFVAKLQTFVAEITVPSALGCNIHFASFKKKSVSIFFTTEACKENELCPKFSSVTNKTGTFRSSFHLCYQLFKGAAKVLFSKLESGPNIILAKGQIHRE